MTHDTGDRIVVITGASRGIGAGLSRALHRRGFKVAGCARSHPVEGAFPNDEGRTIFETIDVCDSEAVDAFAERVESTLGPADAWVNNAGLLEPIGMSRDVDPEAFALQTRVNLLGVLHGAQAFLRRRHRDGRRGTVINISSGAADSPYVGWGAYCATKAAVDQLTRVMDEEERPFGHRVLALAPGIVETGMQELIRKQEEKDFPSVERFREFHRDGILLDPEAPVDPLLHLLYGRARDRNDPIHDTRSNPELAEPFEGS